jgi:hypothetical protein
MSTRPLLSNSEAKALANKLIYLFLHTDIAKGGCNVCGNPDHLAGYHDDLDGQGYVPTDVDTKGAALPPE